MQPPVQGVVLQTYGAGNAPNNRPDLLSLFREAYNWGVIIVNISQCSKGNVGAAYATGVVCLFVVNVVLLEFVIVAVVELSFQYLSE